MKQKHIEAYMKTAEVFADCSTAERLHVGAIIVKDEEISAYISLCENNFKKGA